jgi:signal transduction histidine kinase
VYDRSDSSRRNWRVAALTIGALIAALLLAVTLIFSSAAGAERIARASRDLQWANSTATAISLTRAATAQAVVFGIDEALGVADRVAVEAATAEVSKNIGVLEAWLTTTPTGVDADLQQTLAEFVDEAAIVIDLLHDDRPVAADAARNGAFDTLYASAMTGLGVIQTNLADEITSSETVAGRVALTTRSIVLLLIPVSAILIYRFLARSELRRRRATMEARVEAAEELSKSKDEFIAGISHELRTPLTSIYGFSQHLLDNGIIDPHEALELVALINSDSAELSRMVEDLLTAARLDSDSLEFTIDAVSILEEVGAVTIPLARAGHEITLPTDDYPVWADRVRLRQILRNLVSNAVKHGGGRVELTFEPRAGLILCHIADAGPGVPEHIEPRMFERFVHDGKTTLLTGSVGLGLAISKSLAEHMRGDITYERRGKWTVFTVGLPAAPASLVPEATPRRPMPALQATARAGLGMASLSFSQRSAGEPTPRIRFK